MVFKKDSLAKNYVFQTIYQVLVFLIPLVMVPYLTRVIGDTGLGTYSYVNSIAYYFIVLANLGIAKHGQRVIAKSANDEQSLRKTFWSLYLLHFWFSIFAIALYLLFVSFLTKNDYKQIYFIETLFVASALFDVTWLFIGLENFKIVVFKNIILKIIELVLVFCLIKQTSDLYVYVFIVAGSSLLGHVILLPNAIRLVKPIRIEKKDIIPHIKPLLIFTIAIVATTMYTVFDKTILGIFFDKKYVAYYEYANKILSIPRTFIAVMGTIIYPRACAAFEKNDSEEQLKYFKASLIVASFIGFGSMFGLLGVSKEFANVYFGESFSESGKIMMCLCMIPLIIGLGDIFRAQFLLPSKRDKEYTLCIIINAALNLIFSLVLVHFIGIYGVVVGTIISEVFGLLFQGWLCRKHFKMRTIVEECFPFFVIGLLMYLLIFILHFFVSSLIFLLVATISGFVLYLSLSIVYFLLFKKDLAKLMLASLFRKSN